MTLWSRGSINDMENVEITYYVVSFRLHELDNSLLRDHFGQHFSWKKYGVIGLYTRPYFIGGPSDPELLTRLILETEHAWFQVSKASNGLRASPCSTQPLLDR
jgi:hypothetical protein